LDRWHSKLACCAWVAILPLTGCGPTRLDVRPTIPPLLMQPMPLSMGVRIPKSFSEYVQKEKTQEREWVITLGPGQADAVRTVTAAMFAHTVPFGDAMRNLWPHTLLGLASVGILLFRNAAAIPIMLLIAGGPLLAVPFAVVTARRAVGKFLMRFGLCALPEENAPPKILRDLDEPAIALRSHA